MLKTLVTFWVLEATRELATARWQFVTLQGMPEQTVCVELTLYITQRHNVIGLTRLLTNYVRLTLNIALC